MMDWHCTNDDPDLLSSLMEQVATQGAVCHSAMQAMQPEEQQPPGEVHPADVLALQEGARESQQRETQFSTGRPLEGARHQLVEVLPFLDGEVAAVVRGAVYKVDEWLSRRYGVPVFEVPESQEAGEDLGLAQVLAGEAGEADATPEQMSVTVAAETQTQPTQQWWAQTPPGRETAGEFGETQSSGGSEGSQDTE